MKKQRTSRLKLLVFTVPLLALALFVGIRAMKGEGGEQAPEDEPTSTAPPTQEPTDPGMEPVPQFKELVRRTFLLAREGKVPDIPFVAGKTQWEQVNDAWGKSDQISETDKGRYEEYTDRLAAIGYADRTVSDIRSYQYDIQSISLEEIKSIGGEPDAIRYYKDEAYDQIILVYHATAMTDLLWVLPRPTQQEPDPKVDHISLYSQVEEKPKENQSIAELVSQMSLDEKIGQMILAGISGTTFDTETKNLLDRFHVGGIIFHRNNFEKPEQAVQLINQIKVRNNSELPLFLAVDQEGGRVTRLPGGLANFPSNKKIGEVNSSDFSYEIGALLGSELKLFGLNLNFAPVLDINSNPDNPVIGDRSFGNNPDIVSKLGIDTMRGIRSQSIIPAIKHFPGHGDTSVDSHLELPVVRKSLNELMKLELIPFKRAIDQGAEVVMVAHILLPELDENNPASMSETVMTDILRRQLGFTGTIITDDMTMGAIAEHFDIGEAAVESIKSGCDIVLIGHDYNSVEWTISLLKSAVEKGGISMQRIDESVERIISLKRKYGIKDEKVDSVNIGSINKQITNLLDKYLQ